MFSLEQYSFTLADLQIRSSSYFRPSRVVMVVTGITEKTQLTGFYLCGTATFPSQHTAARQYW